MRSISLTALLLSAVLTVPASAREGESAEAKEWCNEAHMQKMETMIGKMTDAAKKKDAEINLSMSRTAMEAKDMAGCVTHMKQAHAAMGL